MIEVGMTEKKMVTKLNHELYNSAVDIMGENTGNGWHIGWIGVGAFIDWLEANYEIKKKTKTKPPPLTCDIVYKAFGKTKIVKAVMYNGATLEDHTRVVWVEDFCRTKKGEKVLAVHREDWLKGEEI